MDMHKVHRNLIVVALLPIPFAGVVIGGVVLRGMVRSAMQADDAEARARTDYPQPDSLGQCG